MIMHEVGAFEVKTRLGALLDRVERGEEIVISRHGSVDRDLRAAAGALGITVLGG
jgi:antitoxin (DNA-binding transcriptional repressor) of toxin-antitoxin stability system